MHFHCRYGTPHHICKRWGLGETPLLCTKARQHAQKEGAHHSKLGETTPKDTQQQSRRLMHTLELSHCCAQRRYRSVHIGDIDVIDQLAHGARTGTHTYRRGRTLALWAVASQYGTEPNSQATRHCGPRLSCKKGSGIAIRWVCSLMCPERDGRKGLRSRRHADGRAHRLAPAASDAAAAAVGAALLTARGGALIRGGPARFERHAGGALPFSVDSLTPLLHGPPQTDLGRGAGDGGAGGGPCVHRFSVYSAPAPHVPGTWMQVPATP